MTTCQFAGASMEIVEKEVTYLEMGLLIRKGIILEFQAFLSEVGGKKQVYRTKVASQGILYICYHFRPFPFMITESGKIFVERDTVGFVIGSG